MFGIVGIVRLAVCLSDTGAAQVKGQDHEPKPTNRIASVKQRAANRLPAIKTSSSAALLDFGVEVGAVEVALARLFLGGGASSIAAHVAGESERDMSPSTEGP